MPRVGFEPMIVVFERAKTVHALDRAATVIESLVNYREQKSKTNSKYARDYATQKPGVQRRPV
jgi:hypothetical protein